MTDKMKDDKKNNTAQLSEAANNSKAFFDDIDRHFEMSDNEEYRKYVHKFEKGKKLFLEIEVQDSEMSHWLFKWMYAQSKDGGRHIPFGCSLEVIHFENPKEDIKRKLIELVESL